ncbi:MAG: MraY family glycosyltransferase [Cytophagales bacterium]
MISVFAIPSIINVAHLKQLLDEPNLRTIHMSLTPRLGGVAIFAGFTSAITIFGDFDREIQQVLASCIILFFVGLKDDIITLSTFKKFFVQILAAGIVIFIGDIRISNFHGFLGWYEVQPGISYAFSFLVIIGITNAINLIDGLDGLAGSITIVITTIFAIFFFNNLVGNSSFYANLGFALIGGVLGFLRYNFRKAIIFMGDTGSLVCGFLISVFAIKFIQFQYIPSGPAVAVSILILPVVDTTRVFILRILKGKSPFSPDKNHIHHILKAKGLNSMQIVAILSAINIIFFALVYSLSDLSSNILMALIAIISLLLCLLLEWVKK